jgi:hypothetical protein
LPEQAERETIMEGMSITTIISLIVIVIIVALANERIVELLVKVGLIKGDGQAATWQSVIGAVAVGALALAKHLGIEHDVTNSVDALVQAATALALLIPIFGQSIFAKLFHEVWKRVGWVTEANHQLKPNHTMADRG